MWPPLPPAPSSNSPTSAAVRRTKTMEEVWKDISLASDLPRHQHTSARSVILQDFFSKDPPPAIVSSSSPPPTSLTLSSGANRFGSLLLPPHNQPIPNVSAFDPLIPDDNTAVGKKRLIDCVGNSGDRRHKRMIKNRESAARSRARKQESFSQHFFFAFFSP